MHWFSFGVALFSALAIIGIGGAYLFQPRRMTSNFGLPPPEAGPNTTWWLRLKGSRDIVSGVVVLAVMGAGSPYLLGVVLLVEAVTPVLDMLLICAAKGSTRTAFGVHGLTAALMILGAIPLLTGIG